MHALPACVFEARGGWNHRMGCAVGCGHITTAGGITLTDRCPVDTSVWQHEGDTGCDAVGVAGAGAGRVAVPSVAACPHRLRSRGQTSTCLFVSNFINSNLNKMAREIRGNYFVRRRGVSRVRGVPPSSSV